MSISAPYLKRSASGVYYVHWTERGVGKRVSTRAKDLDGPGGAKTFFASWILMGSTAPGDGAPAYTFADIWAVYAKHHVRTKIVNTEKAEYSGRLLLAAFGEMLVTQITQADIDAYVKRRVAGKIGGRPVKPQTVRSELAYMMAAIKFCAKKPHKLLDHATAADITDGIEIPAAGAPRERWLRTEEIQKLLNAAASMRGADDRLTRGERFLWLALETAARRQAILELTWDRVDFETGVIRYDAPGRVQTKKRRAAVPISKALRPILVRAYRERKGDLVLDNAAAIWSAIQLIVSRAGLAPDGYQHPAHATKPKSTGVSPHTLRHTAATHMARQRVPLYMIAAILGNSVEMVTRVYGHHSKEDLQQAVDTISGGLLEAAE